MKHKVIFSLILILCCAVFNFAQTKPSWITAVEDNIRQKETVWKIERKNERPRDGDYSFVLKSGENSSLIQILDSQKAVNYEETFTALVANFDQNMGKHKKKSELKNFGDEGYIWTSLNEGGYVNIKFRKEDIFVSVFAPSEAIALRFARYVLEQMPNN